MIKLQKIVPLVLVLLLAAFLRFYQLGSLPASPYWEEAALGYDAYSILKTGMDHHGNSFPIVAFESFGDWKPSLYFYAAVPSIAAFGLNPFAVRLPSALTGTLTVLLIYLLVKEYEVKIAKVGIQKKLLSTIDYPISLFSAFFLAIMPWHIIVSRVAFETNLGLFTVTLATWLFLKYKPDLNSTKVSILKNQLGLTLSFIFFGFSLYAYHGMRVFTPLLIMGIFIQTYLLGIINHPKKCLPLVKSYLVPGLILLIMVTPIFLKLSDPQISQRFAETSAFATLDPILKSNTAIQQDGGGIIARLTHHRVWYYSEIYLKNYFSHVNYDFLFLKGDENVRHSIQLTGQLLFIQLPLLLLGLFYIFYNQQLRRSLAPTILIWLILAPAAAGITKATPHALRALPMVIPLAVISAAGLVLINKIFKNPLVSKVVIPFILVVSLFELSRFWYYYTTQYQQLYSREWQYGYEQVVKIINAKKADYDTILVTREQGRPAMFYWFYSQTDPKQVQDWNNKAPKDQGEYLQFENIYFGSTPANPGKTLEITSTPKNNMLPSQQINLLNGDPVFYIYE